MQLSTHTLRVGKKPHALLSHMQSSKAHQWTEQERCMVAILQLCIMRMRRGLINRYIARDTQPSIYTLSHAIARLGRSQEA